MRIVRIIMLAALVAALLRRAPQRSGSPTDRTSCRRESSASRTAMCSSSRRAGVVRLTITRLRTMGSSPRPDTGPRGRQGYRDPHGVRKAVALAAWDRQRLTAWLLGYADGARVHLRDSAGLSIQQQSLEPTALNRPFSVKLSAEGGGTQAWSVDSGTLPQGISLAADGTLSGTATAPGHFTFVVKVTDPAWNEYAVGRRKHMADFRSDTRTLMLWVAKVGIEFPTPAIPPLEIGRPMTEATLTAVGGTAPYTWALASRVKLPAGLTLDPAHGTIKGTPEVPGSFALTVYVKDASGSVGIDRMTLEVKQAGDRK